jgi:ribosomal protein S18 acetylase RimI-like enzyme
MSCDLQVCAMREDEAMTTAHDLLEAYDEQLRREGEVGRADALVELGPLMLATFDHGGFVTYRTLEGHDVEGLISGTIVHFRDRTDVAAFEWKTRGHDWPADLGERLVAHGLVAEPPETVMIGEASALAVPVDVAGVTVRRAGDTGDVRRDIAAMLAMQESVFGRGRGPSVESSLAALEDGNAEMWLAEVDGEVVCAGRVEVVPGTEFAGIWGGATVPAHRGRGIYRALVAARARAAMERGARFIHSDCTDMSRPILERSGLVPVTTTTPYLWTR